MQLSTLFFRNPRLLALTLALIAVSGLVSLQLLPRAEDPILTPRNAQIFTEFPGADAVRTEALVTDVIEDMLAEFEEIKEIKSISRAGISTIAIELLDQIDEVDIVWTEMRDELSALRPLLPAGARDPEFKEFELSAYTLLIGLTWELSGTPQMSVLGRLAEDLADALRAVPGTNDVTLRGAPEEEVLVELDPGEMVALGLNTAAVSAAIVQADSKIAAGEVLGSSSEIPLEVSGEIKTLDRLRSIPIDRGDDGSQFVRVGDVAVVTKTERRPARTRALVDGQQGIVVAARMETGRRVDVWAQRAGKVTDAFLADLPSGIKGEILFDQSRYTDARLGDLVYNFVLGAGLVILVMIFTMGWRAAILVGTALPLTTLMVLQGLRTLGIPLHQMSVTGMIIALGLLIDNAIVVVDEVRHRLACGTDPADAVGGAVRHLAVPLLGSTLTTCMAFAPIALMPGGAGEFVGPISLSVILAVASSFFLALTVTPALAGLIDDACPPKTRTGFLATGVSLPRLDRSYTKALRFLIGRPVLGVAVALVAPVLGFIAATGLPEQFFPPADRDQFNVQFYLDPSASMATTEELSKRAIEVCLAHERVERVHMFLGESGPKYYYNLIETKRDAPYYAQALVQLDGPRDSVSVVRDLQEALDRALPGAVVLAQQIEQGPPFDAPVEMHLYGPDLPRLRQYGDKIRLALTELPHVTHVRSSLGGGAPQLSLRLNEEAARLAGVDNAQVAGLLQSALVGTVGGSMIESKEELPIRVRVGHDTRADIDRIATLGIRTASGEWTSLSSLGELALVPETAAVAHRNRRRVYTAQGYLTAGTLPSEALAELTAKLEASDLQLPDGFELEVGGESAKRDEAVGNLASSAALLLMLMAAALVLTFNSFRLAGVIGLVGFLSVGLALLAVALYGAPFGFMTIIGAMGLIGIAINDSIIVLAALEDDPGAARGELEAAVQVVRRASRHVFSTSLTTIAGFSPLIVAGGAFWPPLAVAIAGGVTGATLIAITLVPTAHGVIARARGRARAKRGGGVAEGGGVPGGAVATV